MYAFIVLFNPVFPMYIILIIPHKITAIIPAVSTSVLAIPYQSGLYSTIPIPKTCADNGHKNAYPGL